MTITEMVDIALSKGNLWFAKDAMEFFNCIIETPPTEGGVFVSSEYGGEYVWDGKRRYTIHKFDAETGKITHLSKFGEYATLAEAVAAI